MKKMNILIFVFCALFVREAHSQNVIEEQTTTGPIRTAGKGVDNSQQQTTAASRVVPQAGQTNMPLNNNTQGPQQTGGSGQTNMPPNNNNQGAQQTGGPGQTNMPGGSTGQVNQPVTLSQLQVNSQKLNQLLQSLDPVFGYLAKTFIFLSTDQAYSWAKENIPNNTFAVSFFDTYFVNTGYARCDIVNTYYKFLEGSFINNVGKPEKQFLNVDKFKKFLPCKQDCNFVGLLNANFSSDPNFVSNVIIPSLSATAAAQCKNALPKSLNPPPPPPQGAADVLAQLNSTNGPINIGAKYNPNDFQNFTSDNVLGMLGALTNIPSAFARVMGSKLPANTSVASAAKVMSSAPIDIIKNAKAADLVSNLANMDLNNMDAKRKSQIAQSILAQPSKDNLQKMMQQGDPDMIKAIPLNTLLSVGVDLSVVPLQSVPPAYRNKLAKDLLNGTSLSSLDPSKLGQAVSGIKPSDTQKMSNATKLKDISNIVTASVSNSIDLTSVQRKSLYTQFVQGAAFANQSSDPKSYLPSISATYLQSAAELIVEAPPSDLSILSSTASTGLFDNVLTGLSNITTAKCLSYSNQQKANFTAYAVNYLMNKNSKTVIDSTDITTLGKCFAPAISATILSGMNETNFYSSISYFQGVMFQPNSDQIAQVSAKIDLIKNNYGYTTDQLVSNIGETMVFASSATLNNASVQSSLATHGSTIVSNLKQSRDLNNATVKACRSGTGSDAAITSAYQTFKSTYAQAYLSAQSSSRRKRSVNYAITCTILQTASPDSFSASQLATISPTVFTSCLQTLGASTNSYASDQLASLVTLAKSAFPTPSAISDTNIQYLNVILAGYVAADLQSLVIGSTTTIQTLGTISSWSSAQMTSLITAIKNSYIASNSGYTISDVLGYLGNLACGLSATDVSGLSSTTIYNNQATLKTMTNTNSGCAAVTSFYTALKAANNITTVDSSTLSDMNGIAGGISTSDLSAIGAEGLLSLSSTAVGNLPAATVNSLDSSSLSLFSNSQLSALTASPYYSSFSSAVTSALTTLSSAGATVATTSSGSTGSGTGSGSGSGSGSTVVRVDFVALFVSSVLGLLCMIRF